MSGMVGSQHGATFRLVLIDTYMDCYYGVHCDRQRVRVPAARDGHAHAHGHPMPVGVDAIVVRTSECPGWA